MSRILTGLDDHAPETCANDYLMAKQIADALTNHYPGHPWGVNVDGRGGIVDIFNFNYSGEMGYRLHLKRIYSVSQLKADVIRAGGEVLERFNVRRGAFDEAEYTAMKTDFAGRFLFAK